MVSKTTTKNKTVSIGTSDTDLVNNNPNRVQITFVNNGTNEVHIDIDNTVSTTSGLRLAASGTITLNMMEDGNFVTERFVGIATGASSNVRVYEVVKTGVEQS